MSDETALPLGDMVALNVRYWRSERGLDQQGLADRLRELGWDVDRTTVNRIEVRERSGASGRAPRRVSIDELGWLAVALNVPLPVLLLPIVAGETVQLTRTGETSSVHAWLLWEWMRGAEPLPGRFGRAWGIEWRTGSEPLVLYERVRAAQLRCQRLQSGGIEDPSYRDALQSLVDATADMQLAGLAAVDLLNKDFIRDARRAGINPEPPATQYIDTEDLGRSPR